jgi:hypothetical protein
MANPLLDQDEQLQELLAQTSTAPPVEDATPAEQYAGHPLYNMPAAPADEADDAAPPPAEPEVADAIAADSAQRDAERLTPPPDAPDAEAPGPAMSPVVQALRAQRAQQPPEKDGGGVMDRLDKGKWSQAMYALATGGKLPASYFQPDPKQDPELRKLELEKMRAQIDMYRAKSQGKPAAGADPMVEGTKALINSKQLDPTTKAALLQLAEANPKEALKKVQSPEQVANANASRDLRKDALDTRKKYQDLRIGLANQAMDLRQRGFDDNQVEQAYGHLNEYAKKATATYEKPIQALREIEEIGRAHV